MRLKRSGRRAFSQAAFEAELRRILGQSVDKNEQDAHVIAWVDYGECQERLALFAWNDDGGPDYEPPSPAMMIAAWSPTPQSPDDARYGSVDEFLEAVNGRCRYPANQSTKDNWARGDCRKIGTNDPKPFGWLGPNVRSGDDVQRLIKKGWPEGLKKARELLDDFDISDLAVIDRRRRLHRTDFGDHLNIGDVYTGHHMTAWTRAKRKRAISPAKVDVVLNMITPYESSADTLFWRGAAGVVLSDLLEQAGFTVRLTYGEGGRLGETFGDRVSISYRVVAKDYGQPLDLATATALLHPGVSRSVGVAWAMAMEQRPVSYGWHFYVGTVHTDPGEFVASHEVHDESSARVWIRQTLEKINSMEDNPNDEA